jgi:hypothetical protein
MGEAFKASNSLPLGSAMKPNYEQFVLPTVTHQNGFGSTMLFGVPTFDSRIPSASRQFEVMSSMFYVYLVSDVACYTYSSVKIESRCG